jgi:hypothetical protein
MPRKNGRFDEKVTGYSLNIYVYGWRASGTFVGAKDYYYLFQHTLGFAIGKIGVGIDLRSAEGCLNQIADCFKRPGIPWRLTR